MQKKQAAPAAWPRERILFLALKTKLTAAAAIKQQKPIFKNLVLILFRNRKRQIKLIPFFIQTRSIFYIFGYPKSHSKRQIVIVAATKLIEKKWFTWLHKKTLFMLGGSPVIVVMGGDSCSEVHGFESLHRTLDGNFSHIFAVKIVMVFVWIENKTGLGWPI